MLIIGEEELPTQRLMVLLRSLGCDIGVATSARHGLTIAVTTEPDVIIISDTLPPAGQAFELARTIRAKARAPLRLVAISDGAEPAVADNPFGCWLPLPPTKDGLRIALGLP